MYKTLVRMTAFGNDIIANTRVISHKVRSTLGELNPQCMNLPRFSAARGRPQRNGSMRVVFCGRASPGCDDSAM